jgi:phosphoribosylglycinamide formyltransferase 2
MADKVTHALTGFGIWGVEFFLADDGVYFSELSPRPHDTGMVTLARTQNFSEFELHARAILGLPIPSITLERAGASAVVLADKDGKNPVYEGLVEAMSNSKSDIRIFGKPITRPFRRMGVALAYDQVDSDIKEIIHKAKEIAGKIRIKTF